MNSLLTATALTTNLSFDVNLERQAMFKLPDAADLEVVCEVGSVWITLDGEARDIVLDAHQRFSTPEHRKAIIYALTPAKLAVRAAVPSSVPDQTAQTAQATINPKISLSQAARKAAFNWMPISGLSANGSVGLRA